MNNCYYLLLDLKSDEQLIAEYEAHHQSVWPEIEKQILDSGVLSCEIFRFENRLMMKLEVDESFSFERKSEMDANSEAVQRWEALMDQYQQRIGNNVAGKWRLMSKIYHLEA